MKRSMMVFSVLAMLAVSARAQTGMLALNDIPGTTLVCVTNYGPQVVLLTARVSGLEGKSNEWDTAVVNLASLSGNVTSTNALFTAWLAGISGQTNLWNAAWLWGNHALAGYAGTGAVAAVAADVAALSNDVANLPPPADPTRLLDSQGAYFQTLENGTGTVWQVTGPHTNYTVVLSGDFLEFYSVTRPVWTTNAFPFTDGFWNGVFEAGAGEAYIYFNDGVNSTDWRGDTSAGYPVTLSPVSVENAAGTATVYQHIQMTTNAVHTFADAASVAASLATANANIASNAQAVANVTANLHPFTQTLFGDIATTNVAGFAGFNATNGAAQAAGFTGTTNNQSIARFRHDLAATTFGTATFSGWVTPGAGIGPTAQVYAVGSVYSQAGALLASTQSPVMTLPPFTTLSNLVVSVTFPGPVTNGYFVGEFFSARDHEGRMLVVRTGGAYPATLTLSRRPLGYATPQEVAAALAPKLDRVNGTATNLSVSGTLTLNGDAITAWPSGGVASASIATPITYATAPVAVTSTQALYWVDLSSASTVSNTFAGLTFDGSTRYEWREVVNIVSNAGRTVTWDARRTWLDGVPDLTVTGRYEFALSTVDGIRVRAKQTWPECCGWSTILPQRATGLDTGMGWPSFTTATNSSRAIAYAPIGEWTVIRLDLKWIKSNVVYEILTPAYSKVGQTVPTVVYSFTPPSRSHTTFFADRFTAADRDFNVSANDYYWAIRKTGTDNTDNGVIFPATRKANALERAHIEAGGAFPME